MNKPEVHADTASIDRDQMVRLLFLPRKRTRSDLVTLAHLTSRLTALDVASNREWDERDTAELAALLSEYESVRSESVQTVANRTQIMLLGLAAIGALAGGTLTIHDPTAAVNQLVIFSVFSVAIPLIVTFVYLVWLSEAIRAHRAGYFLASDVEARINAKLGRLVSTWETSLWAARLPRDELFGPSMAALLVFALLAAAAPFFGMALSHVPAESGWVFIGVPYVFFGLSIAYTWRKRSRLRNNPVLSAILPGDDVR